MSVKYSVRLRYLIPHGKKNVRIKDLKNTEIHPSIILLSPVGLQETILTVIGQKAEYTEVTA